MSFSTWSSKCEVSGAATRWIWGVGGGAGGRNSPIPIPPLLPVSLKHTYARLVCVYSIRMAWGCLHFIFVFYLDISLCKMFTCCMPCLLCGLSPARVLSVSSSALTPLCCPLLHACCVTAPNRSQATGDWNGISVGESSVIVYLKHLFCPCICIVCYGS